MTQNTSNRNVGAFVLMPAPLNPIKAFDAEQFKRDVRALMDVQPDVKFLAVDLQGLEFVYSDAFNAFILYQQELGKVGGQFAVIANSETLVTSFKRAGLDRIFKIFASESEMVEFSAEGSSAEKPVERSTMKIPAVQSENLEPKDVVKTPSKVNRVAQMQDAAKPSAVAKMDAASAKTSAASAKSSNLTKASVNTAAAYSAFAQESSSSKTIIIVLILLGIIAGVVAFFMF